MKNTLSKLEQMDTVAFNIGQKFWNDLKKDNKDDFIENITTMIEDKICMPLIDSDPNLKAQIRSMATQVEVSEQWRAYDYLLHEISLGCAKAILNTK